MDGQQFGILHDDRGWPQAQDNHPDLEILSRREVAIAIRVYRKTRLSEMMDAAKSIPNSQPVSMTIKGEIDDPIPF